MTALPDSCLAIIVVNFASHDLLTKNLVPLTTAMPKTTVIVVDNFSNADERAAMSALSRSRNWILLAPVGNLGFGGGMNLGVEEAKRRGANAFLLLNPDARIEQRDVRLLWGAVTAAPMTVFCPIIHRPDGVVWFDGAVLDLDRGETMSTRRWAGRSGRSMPWLTGACMVVSVILWDVTEGFDEQYFLYWEDVDLSLRVLNAGGHLEILRSASAVHDEGGTQRGSEEASPREKSALYYYYNIRNRQLFAALHLEDTTQRAWRRSALRVAAEVLLRGGRRQFLKPRAAVMAALRGLLDGDRLIRQSSPSSRPTMHQ